MPSWKKISRVTSVASQLVAVVTFPILVYQVGENTKATLSATRQSLSARAETLLLAQGASSGLSHIHLKATGSDETNPMTAEERTRSAFYGAAALRIAEEAFLQHRDGQLTEEYWDTRANNILFRMRAPALRCSWRKWKEQRMFTKEFSQWLERELADRYELACPSP